MPLQTNLPARDALYQNIQYIKKRIAFGDTGAKVIGTLPAGAIVLKPISGAQVLTVFNAATTNVLDIGTTADDDLYATDLALGAVAFVPLDEAVSTYLTVDTTFTATYAQTGTAATTGDAWAIIAYIPTN